MGAQFRVGGQVLGAEVPEQESVGPDGEHAFPHRRIAARPLCTEPSGRVTCGRVLKKAHGSPVSENPSARSSRRPGPIGQGHGGRARPAEGYYWLLMYAGPRSLPTLYIRRPLGTGPGPGELPRTPLPRTRVNKGVLLSRRRWRGLAQRLGERSEDAVCW
jgi:hypothetical protein